MGTLNTQWTPRELELFYQIKNLRAYKDVLRAPIGEHLQQQLRDLKAKQHSNGPTNETCPVSNDVHPGTNASR